VYLSHFVHKCISCVRWYPTSVILELRRSRQEDCEFETNLGYIMRSCLKQNKTTKNASCAHNSPNTFILNNVSGL
jgi:hypothetical protein